MADDIPQGGAPLGMEMDPEFEPCRSAFSLSTQRLITLYLEKSEKMVEGMENGQECQKSTESQLRGVKNGRKGRRAEEGTETKGNLVETTSK